MDKLQAIQITNDEYMELGHKLGPISNATLYDKVRTHNNGLSFYYLHVPIQQLLVFKHEFYSKKVR